MIPLIRHVVFAMLFDESAARRWLAAVAGYLAVLAAQVFGTGVEKAFAWTRHEWAVAIVTAIVGSVVAAVNPVGKMPSATIVAEVKSGDGQ